MALTVPVGGCRPAPARLASGRPCCRGPACGSLLVLRGRPGTAITVARARRKQEEPDPVAAGCPVPRDQQPAGELRALQESFQFDWATLPLPEFLLRLAGAFMTFFLTLGLPVSAATFSLSDEPVQLFASAAIGSFFITTILVLRLYIGYAHVGSRLLSATIDYEETGWYDYQVWVKTPPLLMRDRLLGTFTVKPAIERLKRTLLGLGGAMVTTVVVLAVTPPASVGSQQQELQLRGGPAAYAAQPASSEDDYWDRVAQYEPWALQGAASEAQDGGVEAGGRPVAAGSVLDHMRAPSGGGV